MNIIWLVLAIWFGAANNSSSGGATASPRSQRRPSRALRELSLHSLPLSLSLSLSLPLSLWRI